jgi:hypothetical protein
MVGGFRVWASRAVVALVVVLAVGCAGGSDSSSPPLPNTLPDVPQAGVSTVTTVAGQASFEAWQAATTAVCQRFEPQVKALAARLEPPSTPQDVVELIDTLSPLNNRYVDALIAVALPAYRGDEVQKTYDLVVQTREEMAALRDSALAGDPGAARVAAGSLMGQGAKLKAVYRELGVPACI